MPRYHFPGQPAFLEAAAAEIGRPESAIAARRDTTLSAVATAVRPGRRERWAACRRHPRRGRGPGGSPPRGAPRRRFDARTRSLRPRVHAERRRFPPSPSRGLLGLRAQVEPEMADPIYATDEDIVLRASSDFALLCPRDQKLASGTDGAFDPSDRWCLRSASVDFSAQGVRPGQVVQLLGPPATFRAPGDLLIVASGRATTRSSCAARGRPLGSGSRPARSRGLPAWSS